MLYIFILIPPPHTFPSVLLHIKCDFIFQIIPFLMEFSVAKSRMMLSEAKTMRTIGCEQTIGGTERFLPHFPMGKVTMPVAMLHETPCQE